MMSEEYDPEATNGYSESYESQPVDGHEATEGDQNTQEEREKPKEDVGKAPLTNGGSDDTNGAVKEHKSSSRDSKTRSSSSSTKHHRSGKSSHRDRSKERESSKSSSKHRSSSNSNHKSSSSSTRRHSSSSSSRTKRSDKDKDRDRVRTESSRKSGSSSSSRHKSSSKSSGSKQNEHRRSSKSSDSKNERTDREKYSNDDDSGNMVPSPTSLFDTDSDEDDVMRQCRMIFDEFSSQAPASTSTASEMDPSAKDDLVDFATKYDDQNKRKRVAYENADKHSKPLQTYSNRKNHISGAMQVGFCEGFPIKHQI